MYIAPNTVFKYALSACGLIFLLTACAGTSDNPREGGLFSYKPSVYEERAQRRENILRHEERSIAAGQAEADRLEEEKAKKQKKIAQQEAKLKKLQNDLARAKKKLENEKTLGAQQQRRLDELKARRGAIAQSASQLQQKTNMDPALKEAELERLRKELHQLEAEAEALSRL